MKIIVNIYNEKVVTKLNNFLLNKGCIEVHDCVYEIDNEALKDLKMIELFSVLEDKIGTPLNEINLSTYHFVKHKDGIEIKENT